VSEPARPSGWLPKPQFDAIYRQVPRLCVEIVVVTPERGVLLLLRDIPPNVGAWHLPGGTVLFGEPVVDAVKRVARDEIGADVEVRELLGYIEYPSHHTAGLDSPVGLAFRTELRGDAQENLADGCAWFKRLPARLYREQREFLTRQFGLGP
jgi:ADP-ribose pyrophosphatase YjhB (NUDIX family)